MQNHRRGRVPIRGFSRRRKRVAPVEDRNRRDPRDGGFLVTGRVDQIVGRDSDAATGGSVGALLRASRIRCGEDLRQVADALRIRLTHLEAIEEGRYADLPGAAYTLGFVRSYAGHLGLDVEEVIRRLRAETEIKAVRPELSFPVPVSDSAVPTGAIVMIGIAVVAVAYGAYLAGSTGERPEIAQISPVPERVAPNAAVANARTGGVPAAGGEASRPTPASPAVADKTPPQIETAAAAPSSPAPSSPASAPSSGSAPAAAP
ncbi:MAG: helix-turn-helix domain-containing protein, partial [Alphaproteobacteria bacterium]|nr:helix-turn-helix domain-containing protein [Alphaproteobacteria bacterium]